MKIGGIIVVGIIVIIGFCFVYGIISFQTDDCLNKIAENYCEENGMYFGEMSFPSGFVCMEDKRSLDFKLYKFLEEEKEGCKNE